MIEKLKYEIKSLRASLFQMQNAAIDLAKELKETKKKLEIARNALQEASSFAGMDDCNGNAGEICLDALRGLDL